MEALGLCEEAMLCVNCLSGAGTRRVRLLLSYRNTSATKRRGGLLLSVSSKSPYCDCGERSVVGCGKTNRKEVLKRRRLEVEVANAVTTVIKKISPNCAVHGMVEE